VCGCVILSIATGRVEPALIAIPFMVVLAVAVVLGRSTPSVEVRFSMDQAKALDGDEIEFTVYCNASTACAVTFLVDLPAGLELVTPPPTVQLTSGSTAATKGRLLCRRWGVRKVGAGRIQVRDTASTFAYEQSTEPAIALRVYPRPEQLRSLVQPQMLRPRFGSFVSRAAGTGLEFADIREFHSGDQRRHINWKATARHRQMHVNLFHPEWGSDVVLLLDTFSDVVGETASSLDLAVRGATSAAMFCLARRDRVGLLSIGSQMRWLLPGMGIRQLYRIVNSLMETQLAFSFSWPLADAIPRGAIPAGALTLVLTPLVDRRTPTIVRDLLGRGHDIAVVEIAADAMLPASANQREEIARRLWALYRQTLRQQYRQMGLAVSVWRPGDSLQSPLMELQAFRRTSRRVHA